MNPEAAQRGLLWLLFRRFTWRHWRRHWRSTALLAAILALGTAAFLSIRLANRAAVSGFGLFTESLAGESDFVARPLAGRALPEEILGELRSRLDPLPVAIFPVIEAAVSLAPRVPGEEGEPMQLVGADLVALQNAVGSGGGGSPAAIASGEDGESGFRLGSAAHAFFPAAWAARRGLAAGDDVTLAAGGRLAEVRVAGLLENDPSRPAVPEDLILMDLPGAARLLGMTGRISRAELFMPAGPGSARIRAEAGAKLAQAGDGAWAVETRDDRRAGAAKMTHAFRLNLTVLSTLALLVGAYLILQALEAAVTRRRGEMAVLRSLGVEAREIRLLWIAEALVLGTAGSAAGVALGWAGAQLAVGSIARTVSDLYHATTTAAAGLHPGEALLAFGFGVAASLFAGWLPARDAAATPPAQILRSGNRAEGPAFLRRPGWGLAAAAFALLAGMLPPLVTPGGERWPLGGYAAALGWLAAFSLLSGWLFAPAGRCLRACFSRWPEAHCAASQLRRPTGRHRLAAAGLIAATGMAAGMGILVHSFEGTLTGWIGQLLRADLYVAPAGGSGAARSAVLGPEVWTPLAGDPEVAGADLIRHDPAEFRGQKVRLAGAEYHAGSLLSMRWLQAPRDPRPAALAAGSQDGVYPAWINEAMSLRFGLSRGDLAEITLPDGPRRFRVDGVYADYSDEAGTVLVHRSLSAAWFGEEGVSNLAVYLQPGADINRVAERWAQEHPGLVIRSNARLRAEALRVFRQTFAVTYALEAIAVFVAVAGLGLALASLLVERREEMATLKAIGFTRGQLARASALEGAALAGVGLAGGLALSLALGVLLIYVINRQSFGWTLDFRVPWAMLAGLAALTLAASAAAGAAVGWRGAGLRGEQRD